MGTVERMMIQAMLQFVETHGRGMTAEEAQAAIIPADKPKIRYRPAYKHCFNRLSVRGMFTHERDSAGVWRFRPSDKAIAELEGEAPATN